MFVLFAGDVCLRDNLGDVEQYVQTTQNNNDSLHLLHSPRGRHSFQRLPTKFRKAASYNLE